MATLVFNERDVELLYSFPQPPFDLAEIVRCYTFVNRAAPPTYDELSSCLIKAMRAGIVRREARRFVVEAGWFDRIHAADATAGNEIYSMMEFEESFVSVEFEQTSEADGVPSATEYASVLKALRYY